MNRIPTVTVLVIIALLGILACGDRTSTQPVGPAAIPAEEMPEQFLDRLTDMELGYIAGLDGSLPLAIINQEYSYQRADDGSISGFDYHFALALVEALELEADVYVADELVEYFMRDGEFDQAALIADPDISYTPDIFSRVEILSGPLAINEWRQRLMTMVSLFPVGIVLIGNDASSVLEFADLDGASFAVRPGGFQTNILSSIAREHNLDIDLQEYQEGADVFSLLREGFSDYTIDGSIFLAQGMTQMEGLETSPLILSLVTVGWGVAQDNGTLASIIEKFVAYSLDNGRLGEIFEEQMGVDFDFYLDLVGSN